MYSHTYNPTFINIVHWIYRFYEGVSCGHNYCFAWTTEGSLYSWGKCQNGVLGHGVEEDIPSPEEVKTLNKEKIIAVGAGHSHCGIVTEAGRLYMTGE